MHSDSGRDQNLNQPLQNPIVAQQNAGLSFATLRMHTHTHTDHRLKSTRTCVQQTQAHALNLAAERQFGDTSAQPAERKEGRGTNVFCA